MMSKYFFLSLLFLLSVSLSAFSQEMLTITTYYPSPVGVYQQLVANTLGVGDNDGSNSITSADAPDPTDTAQQGDMWIAGDVGIKTGTVGPQRTLHVAGADGMRLAPSVLPLNPASGDIAVDAGDSNILKWYNGTGWSSAGGGGCYMAYLPYVHTMDHANTGTLAPGVGCLTGYTDQGSLGEYGICWYPGSEFGYNLEPGSRCDDGYTSGYHDKPFFVGQAHLCCK